MIQMLFRLNFKCSKNVFYVKSFDSFLNQIDPTFNNLVYLSFFKVQELINYIFKTACDVLSFF